MAFCFEFMFILMIMVIKSLLHCEYIETATGPQESEACPPNSVTKRKESEKMTLKVMTNNNVFLRCVCHLEIIYAVYELYIHVHFTGMQSATTSFSNVRSILLLSRDVQKLINED